MALALCVAQARNCARCCVADNKLERVRGCKRVRTSPTLVFVPKKRTPEFCGTTQKVELAFSKCRVTIKQTNAHKSITIIIVLRCAPK